MQLSKFFALALATSISAAPADQAGASPQAIGVTLYEHINYQGHSYEVPSIDRCWAVPVTIDRKVSSIRFTRHGISCALFRNRLCLPPALFSGLRESVPNLHLIGIGDEVGSIYCGAFAEGDDNDL